MESEVIPMVFDGTQVRALKIDNDPWWVGRDVASVLGYEKPRNAVNAHCKGARKWGIPTKGGMQQTTIIPERDVYRLVFRSKLPAAERFEDWIVAEVIPQIRETGSYSINPVDPIQAINDMWQSIQFELRSMQDQIHRLTIIPNSAKSIKIRDLPKDDKRKAISTIVKRVSEQDHVYTGVVWNTLYTDFNKRMGYDVKKKAKEVGATSIVGYVSAIGEVDQLLEQAKETFNVVADDRMNGFKF